MSFQHFVSTCYPRFRNAAHIMEQLSLTDRSNLIKACQGQFNPGIPSPLRTLLSNQVTFTGRGSNNAVITIPLYAIFDFFEHYPDDPCESAIMLDLLRGCPASQDDFKAFREKGWVKEIVLSHTPNTDVFNFDYFFQLNAPTPFHPLIPDNLPVRIKIIKRFQILKNSYMQYRPTIYPRYTHRNMSFSTRREYERSTNSSLENVPIFGQDDWIRHYHQTGERLDGSVEMRQKWYPSGAKPRTYFAQGGTCYQHSRYLQDFFTNLTNAFPSTNHRSRLDPNRLQFGLDDDGHFLVYDLTSFTSNMSAQRSFCRSLAGFFKGVEVEIFDERYGVITQDLGEMLEIYNEHCIDAPVLNQERVPKSVRDMDDEYVHERASMLGIFGNLMTCTVAHFLVVAPTQEDPFLSDNTAGDDGIILFFLYTYFTVVIAISLVGSFALDKTFRSDDPGAVCLKRPLVEVSDFGMPKSLSLKDNVVPPNLCMAVSYLLGYNFDPRYSIFNDLEITPLGVRISVVGKDLLRFLESAYSLNYNGPLVVDVYLGFRRLVHEITGHRPVVGGSVDGIRYTWPVNPQDYVFLIHDPYLIYAWHSVEWSLVVDRRETEDYQKGSLKEAGDVVKCNSEKWLSMMELLGYVEKEEIKMVLFGPVLVDYIYKLLRQPAIMPPVLYKYTVVRDIPDVLEL